MNEINAEPANLPPEKRRSLLCIPPPREFDANCSSLQWVKRVYDKKSKLTYDSVFVPYSRVDDFLAGECNRGGCLFYRKKVQRNTDPAEDNTSQIRANQFLEKITYHCSCGPDDHRNGLSVQQTNKRGASGKDDSQKATRMSRIAVGESVRVGCQVRFIVRQQPGTEDIAELQYYEKVHVNHGPDAKDDLGQRHTAHRVSAVPASTDGLSGGASGSAKEAAQRAMAGLATLSATWDDDSPNWRFLLVAARHAKRNVEKALASSISSDIAASRLVANANAPDGPRLKDFLERAADERRRTAKRRAAASRGSQSDADSSSDTEAVPSFLPARAAPKKKRSVQEEIRATAAKSRLHCCSTAEVVPGVSSTPASAAIETTAAQAIAPEAAPLTVASEVWERRWKAQPLSLPRS